MPCIYYKRCLSVYLFSSQKFFLTRYPQFFLYINLGKQNAPRKYNFLNARCTMSFPGRLFNYAQKPKLSRTSLPPPSYISNACVGRRWWTSRSDEAARLHSRPIWRTAQAICQSVDGAARFGYNWISLVRYCKYWQPGKLPTQWWNLIG